MVENFSGGLGIMLDDLAVAIAVGFAIVLAAAVRERLVKKPIAS
ncbi:hypothetical protein [Tianweitania sediminis]|nr:hypothetical protein [Tianweitania sediminis]